MRLAQISPVKSKEGIFSMESGSQKGPSLTLHRNMLLLPFCFRSSLVYHRCNHSSVIERRTQMESCCLNCDDESLYCKQPYRRIRASILCHRDSVVRIYCGHIYPPLWIRWKARHTMSSIPHPNLFIISQIGRGALFILFLVDQLMIYSVIRASVRSGWGDIVGVGWIG